MHKELLAIGSDPEVLLLNENNEPISAIGLVPGTKDNPHPIDNLGNFIQTDNVLIEFCVPPTKDPEKLFNNFKKCVEYVNEQLKPWKVDISPSAHYSLEQLSDPQAREFGCSPDYSAWTMEVNESPKPPAEGLRSAGGHVHCSYEDPEFEFSIKMIKLFDLFLGVPSILLDTDKERRLLYGKAGCFRIKSYGFEYRTLSNFWLKNQTLVNWVFVSVQRAMANLHMEVPSYVKDCIDNQDEELAKKIVHDYGIIMPATAFRMVEEAITE